ncbi:MAG: RecQ family ATP-dependent DNA helicase [Phycisphaerae bacterium]|nr:RecQ family ATP-dependent DNA helicase [Phycisphaerae bacterium]
MSESASTMDQQADRAGDVVRKYWGYNALRPLQREAMAAAIEGRDSLVVLPTGGGKSLCYQAPALLHDKPTVVVSPLIALMKDQVDALLERSIEAAFLNSSLEVVDRRLVIDGIRSGQFKLIFVAPERFAGDVFFQVLSRAGVGAFAIDEAHCISHWGHDFRGDYRRLGQLKERFPDVPVHAFTATATPRVRDDIVAQLGLKDPVMLVGDFFRSNLTYRVFRRGRGFEDVIRTVRERPGQAGIVYCIRRADVDELSAALRTKGVRAIGYHAGMTDDQRTRAQDDFAEGRTDVVVATVAFGMGIDRSDIRYVIHAAMPKSIEHYQQETGRAGRDGEPAECILFYSGADFGLWQTLVGSGDADDAHRAEQISRLSEMYRLCAGACCRHRRLVTYFGQVWERDGCGACDVCNGELTPLSDSTVIAQKVLSCIARTDQRHGAAHVADVLMGQATERIVARGHDRLSTFGLIPDQPKPSLMGWIDQLIDQDVISRQGEYRVLKLTTKGLEVLKGQAEAKLYEVSGRRASKRGSRGDRGRRGGAAKGRGAKVAGPEPSRSRDEPFDADAVVLFGKLRDLRRGIASEHGMPAYRVFGDKTLREMARVRPTHAEGFLAISGVGPAKYKRFGGPFMDLIRSHVGLPSLAEAGQSPRELTYETAVEAPPGYEDPVMTELDDPLRADRESLRQALFELRKQIAHEQGGPAYIVFGNKTLDELARVRPTTREEMLKIGGVSANKFDKYGQRFLGIILAHEGG